MHAQTLEESLMKHAMSRLCLKKLPWLVALTLAASAALADGGWHAPQPGTPERAQIMDTLRTKLAQLDASHRDMVFVVRELCVSSTKGWVTVDPQSADGSNHYEPVSAALKRHKKRWTVDIACAEESCPAGTSAQAMRKRVHPQCR